MLINEIDNAMQFVFKCTACYYKCKRFSATLFYQLMCWCVHWTSGVMTNEIASYKYTKHVNGEILMPEKPEAAEANHPTIYKSYCLSNMQICFKQDSSYYWKHISWGILVAISIKLKI